MLQSRMRRVLVLTSAATAVVVSLACGPVVLAEEKSAYSLFRPTPDRLLREMSTDRPDKTESAYTVDAGRLQIEVDVVAYTLDRSEGTTSHTLDISPFNLKVGLTSDTDLQILYGAFSLTEPGSGGRSVDRGWGDLILRIKRNLWGNDGGRTALAVMPFVKLPVNTLPDLNNDIEGGVILPLALDLGQGFGLGLMTEVDWLRRTSGEGYAASFINSATVSYDFTSQLGGYVEVFSERSAEPGAATIVTFDAGLTYAVNDNLQLDAGANVGVRDAADDLNLFVGLSRRF